MNNATLAIWNDGSSLLDTAFANTIFHRLPVDLGRQPRFIQYLRDSLPAAAASSNPLGLKWAGQVLFPLEEGFSYSKHRSLHDKDLYYDKDLCIGCWQSEAAEHGILLTEDHVLYAISDALVTALLALRYRSLSASGQYATDNNWPSTAAMSTALD